MKSEILKTLGRFVGRQQLAIKKWSPEILLATGVLGIAGGTILACKATRKLDDVLDDHDYRVMDAKDEIDDEKELRKELAKEYVKTGFDIFKLYAPAVTLEVVSIGCILGSHGIMKKRNVALMAIARSFDEYRQRVIDEIGEEREYEIRNGIKKETIDVETTDENGNKTTEKKTVRKADPNGTSQYAKFFDASSRMYQGNPEYDLLFLKSQQNYANDLLHTRGHLFLNEVYDALGLDHTEAGALVGWILGPDGDNYVDFGIFDGDNPRTRAFVNGYEDNILLDFNVDGVIYDLIGKRDGFRRNR